MRYPKRGHFLKVQADADERALTGRVHEPRRHQQEEEQGTAAEALCRRCGRR